MCVCVYSNEICKETEKESEKGMLFPSLSWSCCCHIRFYSLSSSRHSLFNSIVVCFRYFPSYCYAILSVSKWGKPKSVISFRFPTLLCFSAMIYLSLFIYLFIWFIFTYTVQWVITCLTARSVSTPISCYQLPPFCTRLFFNRMSDLSPFY